MVVLGKAVCRHGPARLRFSAFSRAQAALNIDYHQLTTPPTRGVVEAMEPLSTPNEAGEAILFRPAKKRKIYRQRALSDVANSTSPQPENPHVTDSIVAPATTDNAIPSDEEIESSHVSISEILRLRKLRKHRVGGVEFRASALSGGGDEKQDSELVLHENSKVDEEEVEVQQGAGVGRRFARQTGLIGDVDKHMMAYIDSELAKRRLDAISSINSHDSAINRLHRYESISAETLQISKPAEKQPATLGKLLEIDLGDEVRDKNVMRTEQARRRLDGEEIEDESAAPQGKRKKPKVGRDGKPWRERKRRTSDDIRRDKLVEEVLRENRIEMYEEPPPPMAAASGDGEADDQIAEAFRREFLDAVSQRQRKKAAPNPPARGAGGKKEEEIVRGPKLGGSRSARAAMREAQLKELKAGKK